MFFLKRGLQPSRKALLAALVMALAPLATSGHALASEALPLAGVSPAPESEGRKTPTVDVKTQDWPQVQAQAIQNTPGGYDAHGVIAQQVGLPNGTDPRLKACDQAHHCGLARPGTSHQRHELT
jgi:hypothetical protein